MCKYYKKKIDVNFLLIALYRFTVYYLFIYLILSNFVIL